jgi:hypothetical protein
MFGERHRRDAVDTDRARRVDIDNYGDRATAASADPGPLRAGSDGLNEERVS